MPFFKIELDLATAPTGPSPTREPSLRGKHLDMFILDARRELWAIVLQRLNYEDARVIDQMYPRLSNEGDAAHQRGV